MKSGVTVQRKAPLHNKSSIVNKRQLNQDEKEGRRTRIGVATLLDKWRGSSIICGATFHGKEVKAPLLINAWRRSLACEMRQFIQEKYERYS